MGKRRSVTGTEIALISLFLALVAGTITGFASAYTYHWVLIHHLRGIEGLLRANYAIGARRAKKDNGPQPAPQLELTEKELWRMARERGLLSDQMTRTGE